MNRSGLIIATNDQNISLILKNEYYKVESDGKVWTRYGRNGRLLLREVWRRCDVGQKNGYRSISFTSSSRTRHKIAVHRLVYAKFVGSLSEDLVINHKDGNKSNNDVSNLELVTQSRNNQHVYDTLDYKPVMGNVVLNWEIVRSIRKEHLEGSSYGILSSKYGISKGHISSLINKKTWIEGKEYR